eukprot:6332045-Prorocentrum_lima.AAC.1
MANSTRAQETLTLKNEMAVVIAQSKSVATEVNGLKEHMSFLQSDYTVIRVTTASELAAME